jgi:bifunctional non-homologous end joining protein LigD
MGEIKEFINRIKAMEPLLNPRVFDRDDYIYQIKWDGVRIIAVISGQEVILINKRGNFRTMQYPELQKLPSFITAESLVLDGEVVALREGKPSFPAVMHRDACKNKMRCEFLSKTQPIVYMVFDILYLNGRDLRFLSLMERNSQLVEVIKECPFMHRVESFPRGSTLLTAADQAGLEGIVAKQKDSYYLPGKKHSAWYKTKCLRTLKCLVAGYTLRENKVKSLLLGIWQDKKLVYVGKAANGLNTEDLERLTAELPRWEVEDSPFGEPLSPEIHYVEPKMGVLVEFLEWTDALVLRFPVIKGFINGADIDEV